MTDIEFRTEVYDPNNAEHVCAGLQLVDLQPPAEEAVMLPLSMQALADHPVGVISLDHETNDFLGYCAVSREYPAENSIEIGALYVHPRFKGQSWKIYIPIKRMLFEIVRDIHPGQMAVVYANSASYNAFVRTCLFRVATQEDDIPADSRSVCKNECPNFSNALQAGKLCCDSIVLLAVDDLPRLDE